MIRKPLLFLLCIFAISFSCCNDDEDIIINYYNVDCETDCLVIYGQISPEPSNFELEASRLSMSHTNADGVTTEVAYTPLGNSTNFYQISVPISEIVDYLPTMEINVIGNDFLSYAPYRPFADLTPQLLPDSIEVDLAVVPWAILNLSLENANNVEEVSYSVLAANGQEESFIVFEPFSTLERSLLTYAERELTLKVNYRSGGQQKEKSQTLSLPPLQDTPLVITLD